MRQAFTNEDSDIHHSNKIVPRFLAKYYGDVLPGAEKTVLVQYIFKVVLEL